MKIAIAPFSSPFTDFFFNLARYFEKIGHEILFIQPDRYIRHMLKENGFKTMLYPKNFPFIQYFNEDDQLICFYKRLYHIKNINRLINKKNNEYSQAFNFFLNHNDFDKIIFWNGDGNVEKIICEQFKYSCMFIENGYFAKTLQVNNKGVNCNADYASLPYQKFLEYHFESINRKKEQISIKHFRQNILTRYWYRLFDSTYSYLFFNILKNNFQKWRAKQRFKKLPEDQINFSSIGEYIFFPLQVNSDTQIVLNSSFHSMDDVLSTIIPILKKTGLKIILKEHPEEIEVVNYNNYVDNQTVFLVKKYPIEELIKNASFVVNVNSSVGLQSIALRAKVLILGKSLYANAVNAIIYQGEKNILSEIEKIDINPPFIEKYIKHFKNEIFINGDWRTPDLDLLHQIANRILANTQN